MRNIFKKRAGDTSLLNMRLILDVENPDLLEKIEFFTVYGLVSSSDILHLVS